MPRRVDEPYLDLQRVSATTTAPVVPVAAAAAALGDRWSRRSVPVPVGQVAVGQDTTRSVVYQAQT